MPASTVISQYALPATLPVVVRTLTVLPAAHATERLPLPYDAPPAMLQLGSHVVAATQRPSPPFSVTSQIGSVALQPMSCPAPAAESMQVLHESDDPPRPSHTPTSPMHTTPAPEVTAVMLPLAQPWVAHGSSSGMSESSTTSVPV